MNQSRLCRIISFEWQGHIWYRSPRPQWIPSESKVSSMYWECGFVGNPSQKTQEWCLVCIGTHLSLKLDLLMRIRSSLESFYRKNTCYFQSLLTTRCVPPLFCLFFMNLHNDNKNPQLPKFQAPRNSPLRLKLVLPNNDKLVIEIRKDVLINF